MSLEKSVLAGRIYQRPSTEPALYFRTPLTPEERKVLEELPGEVLEGEEVEWSQVLQHLSTPNAINADPDSVCRFFLVERTKVLQRLHPFLSRSSAPSSALLKLLLVTLSDHINIAKFTSCLAATDPFTSPRYEQEIHEISSVLGVLVPLLHLFIAKDRSGLMLHRKTLEMMQDFVMLLGQKAGKMENCSEEKALPYLVLIAVCVECVSLQSELIHLHLKTHKSIDFQLLQSHFNALYACLNALHTSSATEKLAWTFLSRSQESIIPVEAQGRNLVLVLLTALYTVSLEHENLQQHVAKFMHKRILMTLTVKLRSCKDGREENVRPFLYIFLIALKIFRLYIRSARVSILLVLEDDHTSISELLSIACWYHFHWDIPTPHLSFTLNHSFLPLIYQEISLIAEAAIRTKVENQVFSLFSQLNEGSVYEESIGKLPIVQSYTLELLSEYILSLVKNGCELTECGLIDAFSLFFSPLFTSAVLNPVPDYDIIDSVNPEELLVSIRRQFYGVLEQLRRFKEGARSLVFAFTSCLHQYKEIKGFVGRVNEVMRGVMESGEEQLVECLIKNNAVECVFQLLHDCALYESCHSSVTECTEMLLTFLSLPSISTHILHNCQDMSERIMHDYLHIPYLADFSIKYALKLMQQPGSLTIAQQFLAFFTSESDSVLCSKLTIALERTLLSAHTRIFQETLTEARIIDAILSRLQGLSTPEDALIILNILKLVLFDCDRSQEYMRVKGYLGLQMTLIELYQEVRSR